MFLQTIWKIANDKSCSFTWQMTSLLLFGFFFFCLYPICVRKTKNSSLQAFSLLSQLLTFSQCKIDGTTDKDWPVPSGNVILFVDGPMAVSKANIDTVVHPEPFKLPRSTNSPNIQ